MARYYTLPDQGWSWAVLLASFGSHCIHGFFLTAVGLLQLSLLDHYKEGVLKTSWALSIFLGLFSISGPLASLIANRWSCRVSFFTGGLAVSISHVMTAFMPNIITVLFSLGILGGTAIGICYASSVVVVGYNFEKKRNFASGVAVSGVGIGAFALAPLMQAVSDHYGYHGLWLMCAGLTLQYCVFGAMLFPSKLEISRKNKESEDAILSKCDSNKMSHKFSRLKNGCNVLSQKALLNVYLSMFLCNLGISLIYVHFGSYVTSVGYRKLDAAFLFSICGICNCLSRILIGSAANASNMDEFVLFAGAFSLMGLSTVVFPLYGENYGGQVFYVVTLGIYSGSCYPLLNSICVILGGIDNLATVFGFILLFTGLGCFMGPLLGGFIVNFGGTYSQSITVSGAIILIGSTFAWCSGANDRDTNKIKEIRETIVIQEGDAVEEHMNETDLRGSEHCDSDLDSLNEKLETNIESSSLLISDMENGEIQ
ncbi:monocarboxylate transporter 13-like [Saccostrea echinata]|uniref:monocarboxylate transporter 13-like n=1 Tax=Saccostrea echinata TaxID=191078 RepID=UPI002A7FA36B|nr:monocarboxylate transporter 13-like [Saccostrea echinata]XP_061194529.1 monocarboxylate transporter 13-like [Saccostrea echinata]XP_061194530.1 monocarboxylate transporter 13-like [Saccostrea echinata]